MVCEYLNKAVIVKIAIVIAQVKKGRGIGFLVGEKSMAIN